MLTDKNSVSHTLLQIQVLGLCTRLPWFGFRLKSIFATASKTL
jgi:hypothetical protein